MPFSFLAIPEGATDRLLSPGHDISIGYGDICRQEATPLLISVGPRLVRRWSVTILRIRLDSGKFSHEPAATFGATQISTAMRHLLFSTVSSVCSVFQDR